MSASFSSALDVHPDACELAGRLTAEKEALQSFTASMEEEFLELGALLRKINSVARQVRNHSEQIIAAASGRAEDAAVQFAFQLLKKAEDLVQATREQHRNVFAVFQKIHFDLAEVARERDALIRTLSPLEMIKVQFRIQASAFNERTRTQFMTVAESVAEIVRDAGTAVGQRFEELERASLATGELASKLAVASAQQKRETALMLDQSREHLSSLNQVLLSSETAAASIAEAGAKIATGVSKVIMALQCQDMARQKFQHIGHAIDEMAGHLERESAETDEADSRQFLADAGRVQLAQLQSVFDQLNGAADLVRGGLREVDSETRAFAAHAVRSGGETLDGEIIGRAIKSIRSVLAVIDNSVENVRTVSLWVVNLKSTFGDCTSQILELAIRLRIAALNAQVFAAQVDTGAALQVVARNTRVIADEAKRRLGEISGRVTGLVDLVGELEQRLDDHRELANMEREFLTREAGLSEQKLFALERDLRTSVAAIGPLERELSESVCRATRRIRFPEAAIDANARSAAFFNELVLQHSDPFSKQGSATHHKIQELKSNYTMAHERDVHDLAVESDGANVPAPAGDQMELDSERLADNIELF